MTSIHRALDKLCSDVDELIPLELSIEPLTKMKMVAKTIDDALMKKDFKRPQLDSIKTLITKINQGEIITRKECKNLPFVLVDKECNQNTLISCLQLIDLNKERVLKRLILVYFISYGTIDYAKKKALQMLIAKGFEENINEPRAEFMKTMKHYSKVLFTEGCLNNMARLIDVYGIKNGTEKLLLPEILKYSSLMVEATKAYYMNTELDIVGKIDQLDMLRKQHNSFSSILPFVADYTILQVCNTPNTEVSKYKKVCLDVFYDLLGDPRFSADRVRWNEVSDKSRTTFLSWLAENDLNLFFTIIEKTAVDRMWSYRKEFWESYLPYITNTWVLFGDAAMYYVKQIEDGKISYGKLGKGTTANQSVFAFQIDEYIFVEWSHNGKLRVWNVEDGPKVFGVLRLDKVTVSNAINPPLEEWTHTAAESGNWQRKVYRWIYDNCGLGL